MEEQVNQTLPSITQFTWWIDIKKRIWVVHALWYNGATPKTILLLQFGNYQLIEKPYEEVQKLVAKNIFKQISPIINESISINSSGGSFTATAH